MRQHKQIHPPRLLEMAVTCFILFLLGVAVFLSVNL